MGPDSVFHRVLEKFSDIAVVSALSVFCCLLIIPGGRALRSSTRVWLLNPPHPIRAFFRELKEPGGTVSSWWLLQASAHLLGILEWIAIDNLFVRAGILSGVIIVDAISVWLIPVAALKGLNLKQAFYNSLLLIVSKPLQTSGALTIVFIVALILFSFVPHSLFFGFIAIGVGQYVIARIIAPPLGCTE